MRNQAILKIQGAYNLLIVNRILAFSLIFIALPIYADCLGPPNSPIVKIRILNCEISRQYDNMLMVTGDAKQVLSVYWRGVKANGHLEVIKDSRDISEKVFWLSANHDCKDIMDNQDKLWLYSDVCNDTGQNIPSVQLQELWPEIQSKAIKAYEAPNN